MAVNIILIIVNYFGGWNYSLLRSGNIYEVDSIRFYTRIKTITPRRPLGAKDESLFSISIIN